MEQELLRRKQETERKEEAKQKIEINREKKVSFWAKPDIFDLISLLMIIIYFVTIFMNLTLLGSPLAEEREIALLAMAIALLGVGGLAIKNFTDKLRDESGIPLTTSVYENPVSKEGGLGFLKSFVFFLIAFLIQGLLGTLVLSFTPLSSFSFQENGLIFAIVSATSEELLFSIALTPILAKQFKWASVPILAGIFMFYHTVVYANFIELLYVAIMRVVYAVIYLISRRTSSIILAHFLNNFLSVFMMGMV